VWRGWTNTCRNIFSSKAAILGDSKFPDAGLGFFKNDRIECFQMLYEMYSGLAFSKEQDRSVAIAGLEKRLVRTFGSKGGYGVFEAYLERGLLWQKPSGGTLSRIAYDEAIHVPSWSWMAYVGPIEYLKFRFANTDWTDEFQTPFKEGTMEWSKRYWGANEAGGATDLLVRPRKMVLPDLAELFKRIQLDETVGELDVAALRCVVIGKQRLGADDLPLSQTHYVLVIRPTVPGFPADGYMRVGVGRLLPEHISEEAPGGWVCVR
jgi:hypothetical protein